MNAIELEDIRFSYDGGATWALDGVTLAIAQGERVCVTGANGSGKSTLARLMAALAAPDEGVVRLLGKQVFDDQGAHANVYRSARRHIGAVFQNPEDQIVTTVLEDDVAFGPENLGMSHDVMSTAIDSSLSAVDMNARRSADPTRMSGGEQQRIAIADMLAMNAQVLILDEPTAMLDPDARADVMHILDELQQRGVTVVLVTHHADETAGADRVIRLQDGRVVEDDDTAVNAATKETQALASAAALPTHTPSGTDSADTIINVQDVSFGYDSPVLDHLSFEVKRGEIVAMMGPNGAGKTTLARLLCALATPSSGSIAIDGIPVATNGSKASRRDRERLRSEVGYVMQHPERQLFAATVAEDVAFGPRNQHLDETEVQSRVQEALETLHISHLADRSPFELSGGQQRLAAIAGVIACHPRVLVMDEPTAGLDTDATACIHTLIRTLQSQGTTVVFISHSESEAHEVADRILTLEPVQKAAAVAATPTSKDPHHSPIAALDPRVTLVATLVLMFSAFAITNAAQLACAAVLTVLVVALSHTNPLQLLKSVRLLLAMFVVCGLLNVFFVRSGTPLTHLGPIVITDDGIATALLYACRFALVVILGAVFLRCVTPTAITDAFAALLKPLHVFGVHTQEIALVMSLALRFIPTLGDEARSIIDAQAARGGTVETGALTQRVKALCAIVVPVFAGALRHADNLSLALDARCYEEGIQRTHWRVLRLTWRDALAIIVVALYIATLVLLRL